MIAAVGLPGVVSLCVRNVAALLEREQSEQHEARRLRNVLDVAANPFVVATASDGARRWAAMQRALDSLQTNGCKRSLDQTRFHDAMLVSCAQLVMGKHNLEAERDAMLAQLRRDQLPFGTLILCPRRWGKSTSVAMFCAALLYTCPRIRLLIMATQRKSASLLLKSTLHYFTQFEDGSARIAENNQFKFTVRSSDFAGSRAEALRTGAVSGVTACAPTAGSIRGESANLVLIDEAAFVPVATLAVLAPLLSVENTSLICISTPAGHDNYYSKLFEKPKDAGDEDPLDQAFLRFHVDLLCNQCRDAGTIKACDHNAHLMPSWLAGGKRRAESLITSDEMYAQELLGTVIKCGGGLFSGAAVSRFLNIVLQPELELERLNAKRLAAGAFAPAQQLARLAAEHESAAAAVKAAGERLNFRSRPAVFVFVDPAGGGASETAAVAVVHSDAGKVVVVGLCSLARTPAGDELERGLPAFFRQLQKHADLEEAHFVVGVENNYGGQTLVRLLLERYIAPVLARWSEWQDPVSESKEAQPKNGLCTTRHGQVTGSHLLQDLLRRGLLTISQNYVVVGRTSKLDMLRLFEQQLLGVREEKNGGISGKTAHGNQDDLAMSLILCLYWLHVSA